MVSKQQQSESATNMSSQEEDGENQTTHQSDRGVDFEDERQQEDAFLRHLHQEMISNSQSNTEIEDSASDMEINNEEKSCDLKARRVELFKEGLGKVASKLQENIEQIADMAEGEEIPKVMNVSTVLHMFKEIKEEIVKAVAKIEDHQQADTELQDFKQECVASISSSINDSLQHEAVKIQQIERTGNENRRKTQVLTQVCNRMNSDYKDIEQRLENLELNNSKKMIVVTGLQSSHVDRKEFIPFLNLFFLENLGIESRS